MPTGYTAAVADGEVKDFRTFALRCARNFGACMSQRDEPTDVLPKPDEPSDYHLKARQKAEADVLRFRTMTVDEAKGLQDVERTERAKSRAEQRQRRRDTESRYRAMLWKVEQWKPPTPDHSGLFTFMRDQLNESIRFDCSWQIPDDDEQDSPDVWLDKQRAKAAKDVGYHTAEYAKEVERTNDRNAWIASLYASLTVQTPDLSPEK